MPKVEFASGSLPAAAVPTFQNAPAVILVAGEVAFFVEEAAAEVREKLGGSDAEVLRFDADATPDAVSDALLNRSLFSPRRIVQLDVGALLGTETPGKLLDLAVEAWGKGGPAGRREAFRNARALLSALELSSGDPLETAEAAAKKTRRKESAATLAEILRDLPEERGSSGALLAAIRLLLERGNDGTVALLTAVSPPSAAPLLASIADRGLVFVAKLDEKETPKALHRLANARAKERETALDAGAIPRLIALTDADPRMFSAELDKLLEIAGPGGRVSAADVRENVEDAASEDLYPFYDAIGRRDASDVLSRLARLLSDRPVRAGDREIDTSEYWPVIFFGMISTEVRRMLLIRAALDDARGGPRYSPGMRYPDFQARFGTRLAAPLAPFGRSAFASANGQVSLYLWYKAAERAAKYSVQELARAMARAAEVDVLLKSSGPPVEVLTAWVARLLAGR